MRILRREFKVLLHTLRKYIIKYNLHNVVILKYVS